MTRTTAAVAAAVFAIGIGVAQDLAAGQAARKPDPVNLTGCLRKADTGGFVLTGAKGGVPKVRTWKTAYITKTSKEVVVTAANGVKLQDHIGRQVTLYGIVDGSHITARTIKRVAPAC